MVDVEQVGLGTNEGHQRHHNRFANRVDGWVGHLCKQLLEVVVQRFVFIGQNCQGAVVTHGAQCFFASLRHRCQQELDVFLGSTKSLLQVEQFFVGNGGVGGDFFHVIQFDAQVFNPLLVGLAAGQVRLEFFVVDHATLFQIDQEHLAGLQAPLANNFAFWNGQHACLRTHDHHVIVGDAIA